MESYHQPDRKEGPGEPKARKTAEDLRQEAKIYASILRSEAKTTLLMALCHVGIWTCLALVSGLNWKEGTYPIEASWAPWALILTRVVGVGSSILATSYLAIALYVAYRWTQAERRALAILVSIESRSAVPESAEIG